MAGRVRNERIPDPDSIASHRHAAPVYFKRERLSSRFAKRRPRVFLVGAREHCVWRTRGTRSFPRLVTLSLSLLAASSAASCFLSSVSFPFARYIPLCLSFSFSFSSPSVYALLQPPLLPHASRTGEIHRAVFPCDAVSPASSLRPRYYLDFHRPEMPSFVAPLFVVRPSSSRSRVSATRASPA